MDGVFVYRPNISKENRFCFKTYKKGGNQTPIKMETNESNALLSGNSRSNGFKNVKLRRRLSLENLHKKGFFDDMDYNDEATIFGQTNANEYLNKRRLSVEEPCGKEFLAAIEKEPSSTKTSPDNSFTKESDIIRRLSVQDIPKQIPLIPDLNNDDKFYKQLAISSKFDYFEDQYLIKNSNFQATSSMEVDSQFDNNNKSNLKKKTDADNNNKNNLKKKTDADNNNKSNLKKKTDADNSQPFTFTVYEVLSSVFGLEKFRLCQEEIINAALNQKDCFVLLPTGGGKSLCYQLPAILTPGVTVVVSPLRSLIEDQVKKLNSLHVPSAHLCADVKRFQKNVIYTQLQTQEPTIKLLYVTPERVTTHQVHSLLLSLYKREKIARFVIDEAHCISQWGHDFRPDYKKLSFIRKEFRNIPIMCLTATATEIVKTDILKTMQLKNAKIFTEGFNRSNIKYQVIPKTVNVVNDITQLIKDKFSEATGIVYCMTKADCDSLARDLRKCRIKAQAYHAGMTDILREKAQREWMEGKFRVIVATIAFGMGIDKPDVRYVIHNSIPKSIDAFYQEAGRAGRDGLTSYSYVFYDFNDVLRFKKIMRFSRTSKATLEGHYNNLKQMAAFCENKTDCRRVLQLAYFGENFDRQLCMKNKETACDNCINLKSTKTKNVTKESKELGLLTQELSSNENVTLLQVAEAYKRKGSEFGLVNIQRILKELISLKILEEHFTSNGHFPIVHVAIGTKFALLNEDNYTLSLIVEQENVVLNHSRPSTSSTGNVTDDMKLSQFRVKCHEELLDVCRAHAVKYRMPMSSVMNLSAISTISEMLPVTKKEFLSIKYVTKVAYELLGKSFLKITKKYKVQRIGELSNKRKASLDESAEPQPSTSYKTAPKRKKATTTKRKRKRTSKSPKKRGASKKRTPKA